MTGCECSLLQKTSTMGLAATLCHHSPAERVRQIQTDLHEVMAQFTHSIDPDQLFTTLTPLIETYGREIAQDDYDVLTRNEHNTLIVSFLRLLSLSAQTMMTSVLLNRDPE